LSDFLFAVGDDAMAEFVLGIQILPTTIMMAALYPVGIDGVFYSMFTTVANSSLTVSGAISAQLLSIWDVTSEEALEADDLQGLTNLTFLTTTLQFSGILFVCWLTRSCDDLITLIIHKSKVGGFVFLTITFLTLAYAIVVAILNVVVPGWAGGS
jgi:hypothetical protein